MPMDFLVQVRDAQFPLLITEASQIDCLAVLEAAKLVFADVPPPIQQPGQTALYPAATLHGITRLGRIALDDWDKDQRQRSKDISQESRKREGLSDS